MNDGPFTVLKPHVKDLGGFSVKRVLPGHPHKMIGPFIFFDHMGPAEFVPGQGIDVRPHPHIGLATVTYLFDGAILHRDSLGTVQEIHPGDVNWMTAGDGIVHSERTPDRVRTAGGTMHGIQTWVALPKTHETIAPGFEHHAAVSLPVVTLPGVQIRLIAGSAFGKTAPATVFSPMFYAAVELEAGAELALPAEYEQRAVYAVQGNVALDGAALAIHHMAVLPASAPVTLAARTAARVMLIGGAPMDGDRLIWWNFVASERELIQQAKQRWRDQQFGRVPGEHEWIPLPEEPKPPQPFS